jgi:hypothetical protein
MATSSVAVENKAHTYGLFQTFSFTGDLVQIEVTLMKQVFASLGFRAPEGDTSTLVIIPLAVNGDAVDFHLSFTASGGYTRQCHFCVRLEGRQNECLYWFYSLRRMSDGSLKWSWDGCAGQGDAKVIQKYQPKGVTFSSAPINQFLTVVNEWLTTNKAELANKRVGVFNDKGARTSTTDQLTLQMKS